MTIHLDKYEISISDPFEDKGKSLVNLKLSRRYIFGLYKSVKSEVIIELSDTHKFPFPKPAGIINRISVIWNGKLVPRSHYIDHINNYKNNLNRYINILDDYSFELNVLPKGFEFNYKSYYREERLKKLLTSNEN